jgi:hypothetical protein
MEVGEMNEALITLVKTCPCCGNEHQIMVNEDAYIAGVEAYRNGAKIQDAFPSFTPDEREFLLTGICPKCWDNM